METVRRERTTHFIGAMINEILEQIDIRDMVTLAIMSQLNIQNRHNIGFSF